MLHALSTLALMSVHQMYPKVFFDASRGGGMKQLKCTRRTFLKTAAATSVALGLTSAGAPVALAEGNATQAAGDVQKIRTHCRACGKMECAIWAWVQDGRVIDLTGDESAISSRGHICAKGKSAMQALYHPDRVRYPMKRTNPKGEDPGWVRISWDEALELGAKGFQEAVSYTHLAITAMTASGITTRSVFAFMVFLTALLRTAQ